MCLLSADAAATNADTSQAKHAEESKTAAGPAQDEDDEDDDDEEDEGGDIELVLDSQTPATTHHGRTFSAITLKPTQSHKQRHNQHSQLHSANNNNSSQQQQQQQQQQHNQSTASNQLQSSTSAGPPSDHPFRLPYPNEAVYSTDMDAMADKPWRRPGADVSDWFNYGFDEETWKVYAQKQMQIRQINRQVKEGRGGAAITVQQPSQPAIQQPQQQQLPPHPHSMPHAMAQPPQLPMPPGGGMARPFIPPPFVPSHPGGPPPSMPPMGGHVHGGPFGPPPYGPPPSGYYGPPPGAAAGGRRGFSAMPPQGIEGVGGGGMVEGGEYGKRGREEWDDGRGEHVKRERMG